MRNFFVVLACMTSILLIVACAKSPVSYTHLTLPTNSRV